ncbi:MAG: hypothetical protein WCC57_12135 [Paracoccaceae bacterium]
MDTDAKMPGTVLVIDVNDPLSLIEKLIPRPSVVIARFAMLNAELLARVRPECVILPLLSPAFDAIQAIQRLILLGYSGSICVFAPPLPNRAMVEAELRGYAPGVVIKLMELPQE